MRKTILVAMAIVALGPAPRCEARCAAPCEAREAVPAPGVTPVPATATTGASAVPSRYDTRFLTVPAETEASVQLLSGIHTRVSRVDDPVAGRLLQPIYVDGQIALPSGSLLYGRVTHVRAAGRMHRAGELGFRFEEISLPNGDVEPINAVLASLERPGRLRLDHEGYLKGGRGLSWRQIALGLGGGGAVAALGVEAAALGTVLPAGAAGLIGFEIFWPRGDDVHLPPDTHCTIRLDYSLTVRNQS